MNICSRMSILAGSSLRVYRHLAFTITDAIPPMRDCVRTLTTALCLSIFSSSIPSYAAMSMIGHSPLIPEAAFEEGVDGHLYAYLPFGKYVYLSDQDRWEFKEWVNFEEHLRRLRIENQVVRYEPFMRNGKAYSLSLITDGAEHSPKIDGIKVDVSAAESDKQLGIPQQSFTLNTGNKIQCHHSGPQIFAVGSDDRFLWFGMDCFASETAYPIGAGYFDEQLGEINLIEFEPRLPKDNHFDISSVASSKRETWITGSGYSEESNIGLILFDHATRTFSQFIKSSYGLIENETLAAHVYKDSVWIITSAGFNKFEPSIGKWTRYMPSKLKAKSEINIRCSDSFSLATVEKDTLLNQTGWVDTYGEVHYSELVVGLPEPFTGTLPDSYRERVLQQWNTCPQERADRILYTRVGDALGPQNSQAGSCWLDQFWRIRVVSDPYDQNVPLKVELNEGIIHPKEVHVEFVRDTPCC